MQSTEQVNLPSKISQKNKIGLLSHVNNLSATEKTA